ncbi:hypothetical protein HMPREF9554_01500 [Treponema phagedenis F0421]|nr:hypothetical protein HMPREF9554_01500 [Treponema phagedenis F0421]
MPTYRQAICGFKHSYGKFTHRYQTQNCHGWQWFQTVTMF